MERTLFNKMKQFFLLTLTGLVILSCEKETDPTQNSGLEKIQVNKEKTLMATNSRGASQISGISVYAESGQCNDAAGAGASYVLSMTGDLVGCFYVFVEEFDCSPSGTYRETGTELFVGTYKGEAGTFRTAYRFEGKYEGCAVDGSPIGAEILGRCQHPIVEGSGTGVFAGVKGRLDMKDDIEAQEFPFRGHLQY